MLNFDDDDFADPDLRLDIYIVGETDYKASDNSQHENRVTNFVGEPYSWADNTSNNVRDGDISLYPTIHSNSPNLGAMWIFQDLNYAWKRVFYLTNSTYDAGSVNAFWEESKTCVPFPPNLCGSFFSGIGPFIFISDNNRLSSDTVMHETGHNYMWNATGWRWWNQSCWNHWFFTPIDVNCSWSEGWANFLPLVVNSDWCYDFGINTCIGIPYIDYVDLENQGFGDQWPLGDDIEGRVTGALYDLVDPYIEEYDTFTGSFTSISDIVFFMDTGNTFRGFWDLYSLGREEHNNHDTIRALYQNTIDYDTPPVFAYLLPDLNIFENDPPPPIDLSGYCEDYESLDSELNYQVSSTYGCVINLDGQWLNIEPVQDWTGTCEVNVTVSDSIRSSSDSFQVNVIEANSVFILTVYFMITR